MATKSYTTNLKLVISSDLSADAKYNLQQIDVLAGTYKVDTTAGLQVRAVGDVTLEPQSSAVGGAGTGGNLFLGTGGHSLAGIWAYGPILAASPLQFLDQGAGGNKYLHVQYKSDASGSTDTTADRTLSVDTQSSDRKLVLGGDLSLGGNLTTAGILTTSGDITLTGPGSVTLPASGTLATRAGAETLTNKTIVGSANSISGLRHATEVDNPSSGVHGVTGSVVGTSDAQVITNKQISAVSNSITGLTAANLSATPNIPYSALVLTSSVTNSDISAAASIAGSKVSPDFVAQTIATTGQLSLGASGHTVRLQAPAGLAANLLFSLPASYGAGGNVLQSDGSGGLAWASVLTSGLPVHKMDVGDSGGTRIQVDTSSVGDILADTSTGLTLKSGVVTPAKLAALGTSKALVTDGSGLLTTSATTATQLGYLSTTTSDVQTQLGGKQATGNYITSLTGDVSASGPGAAAATISGLSLGKLAALTVSRALVSDVSGVISASATTATELGYVSGVTSAIQTQLNARVLTSSVGASSGVASLDSGGKVPLTQLPSSIMEYKGTWNASTNTPTLSDGTGTGGYVYKVSASGTQNLGSGSISFVVGDYAIHNGSTWERAPSGADVVTSVAGRAGDVTLSTADISGTWGITRGGTGQGSASAGFDALSPMTTLGDVIYGGASGTNTRLAGNTTSTRNFLRQTGTGTVSAAPAWDTLQSGDIPSLDTGKLTTGTLAAARGGTNLDTSSSTGVAKVASGTWSVASLVNADVSSSAAIAASKLALTGITAFALRDTSAAFDVTLAATSSTALTAGRTLTLDLVNAARTMKLGGDVSHASSFTTAGAFAQTLTATGATNVTLPTTGTLATLAGAETLSGKTFGDAITLTEIATPANPSAGTVKVYSKSGDGLFTLNSAGTETQVGSGSGQKNYVAASTSSSAGWLLTSTGTTGASVATISTDTTAADLPRANTTKQGAKILPVAVSNSVNAGTFTATNATPTVLTFANTGMQSGYVVYLANNGGGLPTGLSASTPYWVTMTSATTGKLSTSYANYLAGTFVAASSTGTGTQYYGCQLGLLQFTLDAADYNVKQQLQWAQNILSGAAGDWQVDVYYNTASNYTYNTYTRVPLSTDSSSQTLLPNLEGTFRTTFDAPGSGAPYVEVRFQNISATGNTHALVLSDLVVGPGVVTQGPAVNGWTSFTPTVNVTGTGTGTSASVGYWRRVGDTMEVQGYFTPNGTSTVTVTASLPSGYTINTAALSGAGSTATDLLGHGFYDNSTNEFSVVYGTSTSVSFLGQGNATRYGGTSTIASGKNMVYRYTAPINEWAGNGTINVSQNDVEFAWNSSTTDANDTTSFGYGPAGGQFGSFTAERQKTVQFLTPISATDQITLEITSDGGTTWSEVGNGQSSIVGAFYSENSVTYGMTLLVSTSTQVLIDFGQYRRNFSATYGGAGSAWSGIGSSSTYKYRVKKAKGGQAVGFGQVTQTAAGLVQSAGQLLGTNTNDSAIAGNVGETGSVTGSNSTGIADNTATTVTSTTIHAGDYLIWGHGIAVQVGGDTTTAAGMQLTINTVNTTALTDNTAYQNFTWMAGQSGFSSYRMNTAPMRVSLSGDTVIRLNFLMHKLAGTTPTNWEVDNPTINWLRIR